MKRVFKGSPDHTTSAGPSAAMACGVVVTRRQPAFLRDHALQVIAALSLSDTETIRDTLDVYASICAK